MTKSQQRKAQTGEPTANGGQFGSGPVRAEADTQLSGSPATVLGYRDENGDYRAPDGSFVASWMKARDQVQTLHDTIASGIGEDAARETAMANVRTVLALFDRERVEAIDQLLSARDPRIDGAAEAISLIAREHYPTAATLELEVIGNPWSNDHHSYFRPTSINDVDGHQLHRFGVDLGDLGRKLMGYTPHLESDLDSFKGLGPGGRDGSYRVRL